ncbi:MAG: hypothetical protein LBT23_09150 [Synergistaceae bacterium]|nr:hypothetical protein [Synergistaceae bacterium]
MWNRSFDKLPTQAVNTHGDTSRIESKNRKGKAQSDSAWREVWITNLEKYGIGEIEDIKNESEPQSAQIESSSPNDFPIEKRKHKATEEELGEILLAIREMADNPEKLFESHLGIFIDPTPPGKVINSRG